jgi:hypothetical protein
MAQHKRCLTRRCFRRRGSCPECGARSVLVRYERAAAVGGRSSVAIHDPIQLRCTNKACIRYWR